MGVLEVLFDPESGETVRVAASRSSDAPGDRWKVICEDDAVSILADQGDGQIGLIGAGRWTGKGIAQRYATGDPIADSSWGKLEHALRRALAGPAADDEPAVASALRPPATVDPAESGYTELIVELASGNVLYQRRSRSDRRAANAFEWKVVVAGERVTVHANDEVSFARATWDGERLTDREVRSKQRTINAYQWGVVEKAVIEVITGRPAPMPRLAVSGAATGSAAESATATEATSPEEAPRPADRRSGWWALAAAGVALAGTIVSWQAMPPGDGVALGITIALAAVTLGLVIYGGIGLGTRCPSCRAWYRRETTSTDVLGTSTYSKQIEQPVRDSSGKQIGTTSETATYERTDYRYHYRCKECAHRWTGTGSSDRRIS